MMKKSLATLINRTAATVAFRVAKIGAGVQSFAGWYQPKVPKRIAK
ncbi:MAG: cyclic lactone autoinducer peptide [Defluviitaleaceae bacterium]|nr:cyclic lactone autoinducer peptide [Defluviitaleaceae bacterium]